MKCHLPSGDAHHTHSFSSADTMVGPGRVASSSLLVPEDQAAASPGTPGIREEDPVLEVQIDGSRQRTEADLPLCHL